MFALFVENQKYFVACIWYNMG